MTPGQTNLYVASLGYMLFGLAGAFLAVVALILPAYAILPLVHGYERWSRRPLVRNFIRGLTSASVGLIFAATVAIGRQALVHPVAWVVLVLTGVLTYLLRWPPLLSLLAASGAGTLLAVGMPAPG